MKHSVALIIAVVLILAMAASGCQSNPEKQYYKNAIVKVPCCGPLQNKNELRDLNRDAANGNAEASFLLYSYYNFVKPNERLRIRYFNLALKLEHPTALFLEADNEWSRKLHPDIEYAERMVKRSIELGYKEDVAFRLLKEIETAKETGIVPLETEFRSFGDYDR